MSADPARDLIEQSKAEERLTLRTQECAERLGVTGEFIRGEIRDGRLKARVFRAGRKRAKYRIEAVDFAAYVARYWPMAV